MGFGSLASGALNFAGTLAGISAEERMQREQYVYDQKAAEAQYKRDLEAWNMENEYNSPENQMARYREAGLNPHLMYGSIANGNTTNTPSFQVPVRRSANIAPYIAQGAGQLGQILLHSSEIDSQIELNKSMAAKNYAEANSLRNYRDPLYAEQTNTQKYMTAYWFSHSMREKFGAAVDGALQDINIAIGYQKLDNLVAEEKGILAKVAADNALAKLHQSHISMNEFNQECERIRIKLETANYHLKADTEQYKLNLERMKHLENVKYMMKHAKLQEKQFIASRLDSWRDFLNPFNYIKPKINIKF